MLAAEFVTVVRMRLLICILVVASIGGCVRRTIEITSEPEGALVWLNDREVGRTPCSIEFTYYGRYDVRLRRDGYEPISGFGDADEPAWDFVGADLVAEVIPAKLTSRVQWHFSMVPTDSDEAAVLERAKNLRARIVASPEVEKAEAEVVQMQNASVAPLSKAVLPVPSSVLPASERPPN